MADEEEELKIKIRKLVNEKFEGDYQKGFKHYHIVDGEDLKIDATALGKLLADAGVGNWLTRSLWVEGVLKALDKDKDGAISWDEFESILEDNPKIEAEPNGKSGTDSLPGI